jgi:uncharacterized protein (TIGR02186 family)
MTRLAGALALVLAVLIVTPVPAEEGGQDLFVDLSSHRIEIGSRFVGTSVIMFGAVGAPGDVIVVVRGPRADVVVHRKARSAGLWLNADSMEFADVPQYYALATTRPLDRLLPERVRAERQIGVDELVLSPRVVQGGQEVALFREALVRERVRGGLYSGQAGAISFIDARLFRASLDLPAQVPIGSYRVEVLLVRDGVIVAERTTPLVVTKTGLSAEVFDFAHTNGAAYAGIAIVVALLAGWLGYALFRKV